MRAYLSINGRGGDAPETGIVELLDRYAVDVFVGTGLPMVPPPHRPRRSTLSHLERAPGWTLVFRSLRSAVYLRGNERNRGNLDRIAAYYARAGVPFDREVGFDAEGVLREARGWAIRHGLAPRDYARLVRASLGVGASSNAVGLELLAASYAALGPLVGRHNQQHGVHPGGARDHVAYEAFVPRNVHERQHALGRQLQIGETEIDRDASFLLLLEPVGMDPGQRLNERALAVVDVSGGAENEVTHEAWS